MKDLFDLGEIYMTRGVAERCENDACFCALVQKALEMHATGNWGDVCDEDWETNNEAVKNGERILSSYYLNDERTEDEKIWIITEWDRSVTTILFPDEY